MEKRLEDFENRGQVETIHTTPLLRSARIMRRVLETPVNDHQLTLVRKTRKILRNNNNNKWTIGKLKQMDQRTRKLITVHKVLHPRDDVDRLYVSRKEGRRGLANIEDSVDASIQ